MVFLFPDDDTLYFALTGGLVPPAISLAPAEAGRNAGGPWIAPTVAPTNGIAAALRRIGVQTADSKPSDGRDVAHWLEAIPLRRDPSPPNVTDQTPILFELPEPAGLGTLVGEMLRLGNDRQAFRLITDSPLSLFAHQSSLLRVIGPPYYSLLRAIDGTGPDAPRAYLERVSGVWVEVGWTHPLVGQIQAPPEQLLLLRPPQEWVAVADAPFRDVYDVLEFQIPGERVIWTDAPPANKLAVPLRIAPRTTTEVAELWVLRDDAVEQIDTLVRDADDQLLARFAFAVGEWDGGRVAVLRVRPAKGDPPVVMLEHALACQPYLRLPNLYLPVGRRLRPPLRRDAVRRLLADDADRVVWLAPDGDDSFIPQSLPESAFHPLSDWVEYVLDRDATTLTAWVEAATFEFGSFVGKDVVTTDVRQAQPRERKPRGAAAAVVEAAKPKIAAAKAKPIVIPVTPLEDTFANRPPPTPSEVQIRLKEAEAQFLAADGPLDDPRRLALWPELARLNGLLGHKTDASLAWANALWEPRDPPPTWAWGWVEAEQALPKAELTAADLDRLLANAQPAAPDLRPLAAALAWAIRQKPVPAELRRRSPEVQRYLAAHDHLLPVRAVWLVWYGLAQLAGADVLTLARVRDRLLERLLSEGLGAERDLPGFLRFAGQREGDRLRTVRDRAERLRHLTHQWSGFLAGVGLQQTASYIDLVFAFGFARLGEAGIARNLLQQASAALEASGSEAHTFLLEAFRYRIDQAIAGKPHTGPLPREQLEYLEQMRREADALPRDDPRRLAPYVIDRMLEQSRVLQPQEQFDPYRHIKREQDELLKELVGLPALHERKQIGDRVRSLVARAAKSRVPDTQVRVLTETLSMAGRVGADLGGELLTQVGPALDAVAALPQEAYLLEKSVRLLERAVLFAAHFDLPDLVKTFTERLGRILESPTSRGILEPLGKLVAEALRGLRKLGLKDQAERLLQQIERVALAGQPIDQAQTRAGGEWQETLRLLLDLAAGWLYLDRPDEGRPVLDAARAWILSPDHKSNDLNRPPRIPYTAVVCAYITASSQAPLDEALSRIDELFTSGRMVKLQNTFTTQLYFSRFHLNIVEAVVLALANEDIALGPAARRWLDDDEYLVRRRIHRDVRTALNRAGM